MPESSSAARASARADVPSAAVTALGGPAGPSDANADDRRPAGVDLPVDPNAADPTGAPGGPLVPTSATASAAAARAQRAESTMVVADERAMVGLLGSGDALLRQLEESLDADIHVRGNRITLRGGAGEVALAERALRELLTLQESGSVLDADAVRRTVSMLTDAATTPAPTAAESPAAVLGLNIVSRRGRVIRPKTLNQKRYVDAIDEHTIVFGIGPAGTGKTYLAMAKAVQSLQAKQVNRIILTRPAVEAGERLGFLPGTLSDKIDPYLRPLYDALHDMLDPESIPRLMASGTIEVAPLAYMRGRTLNDAFIILDEAQNTTPEQMKMFLTRLGFGSKIVVTGDVTQVDLPGGQRSGLQVVRDILADVEDVAFPQLTSSDVVRHRLVGRIVEAYEQWDADHDEAAPDRQDRGPLGGRRGDRSAGADRSSGAGR